MKLILGGAYQGKLDFARNTLQVKDTDVFHCTGTEIDFSRSCITDIEEFTYACVRENRDALAYFQENRQKWEHSILICQDIFCGVVPLGAELRAWRQNTGLLCQYLAGEADSVSRIYCGLEQKLK